MSPELRDPEPYPDYVVVYEAVFEPSSLDKARVEIWVTMDGRISIGFERYKRVAQRFGVKSTKYECVFAAGHEPAQISESGLLALLDMIADGQIAITATVIPFFGLISTKALILQDSWSELVSNGYSCPAKWLRVIKQNQFPNKKRILKYKKW